MQMRSRQQGFTLIEVMVVVVIIALMGAIVAPQVWNQLRSAQEKRVYADIRAIDSALKLYRLDNFSYPNASQGLEALVSEPSAARSWRGPYLDTLPKDPWDNTYQYRVPSANGLDFDLFSFGADGVEGGTDDGQDLGNWALDQ